MILILPRADRNFCKCTPPATTNSYRYRCRVHYFEIKPRIHLCNPILTRRSRESVSHVRATHIAPHSHSDHTRPSPRRADAPSGGTFNHARCVISDRVKWASEDVE